MHKNKKKIKIIFASVILAITSAFTCIYLYISDNTSKNSDENTLYNKLLTYENIVYKKVDGKELTLNIMMPKNSNFEKIPVILFMHGGSWTRGDATTVTLKTRADTTPKLLDAGYAVISVEYSLIDGNIVFPQNIIDVKDAVRWTRKNSSEFNFDENNIGLWGVSAGSHLALMGAYTPDNAFFGSYDLQNYSSKVNYVINMEAPVTLNYNTSQGRPNEVINNFKLFFGKYYDYETLSQEQLDTINSYFPLNYVNKNTVPTLIFHGTNDTVVSTNQSQILYDKLIENNCIAELVKINGADHGLTPISQKDIEIISEKTLSFINSFYKN